MHTEEKTGLTERYHGTLESDRIDWECHLDPFWMGTIEIFRVPARKNRSKIGRDCACAWTVAPEGVRPRSPTLPTANQEPPRERLSIGDTRDFGNAIGDHDRCSRQMWFRAACVSCSNVGVKVKWNETEGGSIMVASVRQGDRTGGDGPETLAIAAKYFEELECCLRLRHFGCVGS